ncbi:MAG TPA: translocation/assembly module TamB domain-containing protein [Steroidobacteraceae bacterium]|nr:translocation/assembly module TamB domain-containing protein [Steroidobacteraceae bacterium]
MRRPARIASAVAAGLLGLMVLVIAAVLVIPNTTGGRALIIRETAALTDGKVRLAGIHGRFPGALDLDRIELRDRQGPWLWAQHISLRWSPAALVGRHILVDSLHIALLHVERYPLRESNRSSGSSSVPHTDVRDLSIDTLELGRALTGDPASLSVKASAHVRSVQDMDAHLALRRIAGDGDYEADAHLDPQSIDATLQLREPAHGPLAHLVKVPDAGALSAQVAIRGPRAAENLQLSVAAGPLQARANGRIDLHDGAADLGYSVVAPAMTPAAGLAWQSIDVQGQLHGPLKLLTADGHVLIKALQIPGGTRVAQVDARVQGDRGSIDLKAAVDGLQIPGSAPDLFAHSPLTVEAVAHLDDPTRPVRLTAHHALFALQADAVTVGRQHANLRLEVPDLKPLAPVAGAGITGDAQVTAHLDYAPSASSITANLSSHLDAPGAAWAGLVRGGLTQLQAAVDLSDQRIEVRTLRLTARAITFTADGSENRRSGQDVQARFELGLPDVHRLSPSLAGDLQITGTVAGPREQLGTDTRLAANLSVSGSPRGKVSARIQAKGLPQAPQATVEASGELEGSPLQVNAELRTEAAGALRAIIQRAHWKSANAHGDITLARSLQEGRGSAHLQVGQLSDFSGLAGRPLSGSVNGELQLASQAGRSTAQLQVDAHNVATAGITANAQLHAGGPLNALEVTLRADSPAIAGQPARISAVTTVDLGAKRLRLSSLQASWHDQDLRLLNPAQVQFAQGLTIQHLKLGMRQAIAEVNGAISPALDVHAALRHVDPTVVNAFVPGALASGTADAEATLKGTLAAPTGTVQLQLLHVRALSVQAQGLPASDLRATAHLHGDTADIDAHLSAGGSRLMLTGKAPMATGGSADLKVSGNIDLALANPILEAGGEHVTGTMSIDTRVTGPTSAPQIAGSVRLSNGSVRDYAQGISLTDISGRLTGAQGLLRIEQLTARAAPGDIAVQGTLGVLQPKIPVDLKITAKNAQPIASNIITANLNADLQIDGAVRDQLNVNGSVHVNKASISIPGGLPPEVAVLDVERDGVAPPPPAANPLMVNLHVDVDAPNRILVTGRGLDAEMGGSLHVRGTTAVPRVTGGFELERGFFTLASSRLTFSSGTVTFNGSGLAHKLDPSLDFTAQTQAAEVTAIVHITGLADSPKIALSSTPELPSDEILSRILFGEPAAQLTALQVVEIGAALASLRGGGNGPSLNPLARLQKALGLDRLSVGSAANTSSASSSTQASGASVEAGRYVSNRVYVGVKEGTTGSSQVDVDVDLTKNLKLQAQLGNGTATAQGVTPENDPGSSLGVAYQFEY